MKTKNKKQHVCDVLCAVQCALCIDREHGNETKHGKKETKYVYNFVALPLPLLLLRSCYYYCRLRRRRRCHPVVASCVHVCGSVYILLRHRRRYRKQCRCRRWRCGNGLFPKPHYRRYDCEKKRNRCSMEFFNFSDFAIWTNEFFFITEKYSAQFWYAMTWNYSIDFRTMTLFRCGSFHTPKYI